MERSQSPTVPAPGGVGVVGGGGWTVRTIRTVWRRALLTAVCASVSISGVGCLSVAKATRSMKETFGLAAVKPATVLTTAFQPQIQYLSDPTQDEVRRPGIVGQMFLTAADGQFTEVDGDLTVMATDVTPRPPGQPSALREMWHFDKASLRKLKTKDERFGDTYALFLPYPPNWKDVTHIAVETQYVPKPDGGGPPGLQLSGNPQQVTLDYSVPGSKPVWTKVANGGDKPPTAPAEMKGMPDLGKVIAQNRVGAPLAGPQPGVTSTQQAAAATTPQLPLPVNMTNNPYAAAPGPNGSTVHTTGYALPPGQTIPPGWTVDPNTRALVPPAGTTPWAVTPPANAAAPPAGYRAPAAIPVPPPNFPAVAPPGSATAPVGALPPSAATYPMGGVPAPGEMAPLPAIPPGPGAAAAGFDPNLPVGPWANTPTAPGGFPPMTVPPPAGNTTVIRR